MSLEKKIRNRNLYQYRLKYPMMSIAAIARVFHIPRQVAWVIIQREKKKDGSQPEVPPDALE